MCIHRLRWWLAALLGLLSLLLPACSESPAPAHARRPDQPAPPAAGQPSTAAARATRRKPAADPATPKGAGRRHPFVPVRTSASRRVAGDGSVGPLALKGVFGPEDSRTAVIQEGEETHFVQVGDQVGGLSIVSIRDAEVELGAGRAARVLLLYDDSTE